MSDFWEGRNVLVTGATGFIGSWLTETLVNKGANVSVLVKKDDPLGTDSLKIFSKKLDILYGDIRDNSVARIVKGKEFVFHLAAITQVIYSIKNPLETFDVNFNGTINLLEQIRKTNSETFLILASTDKVYGEPKYLPIDEEHPLLGKSPYDASKIAADRAAYVYFSTYSLPVSIIRCSNIYGGRDSNGLRAIPDFITSIINNQPPVIRGNGEHKRDYLFIADAVEAYLKIAENIEKTKGETFNFGTSRPTTVKEVAQKILELAGLEKKMETKILNKPTKGEIDVQYLSSSKASKKLGWKPEVGLENGLRETIQWYKENPSWMTVMRRVASFYGFDFK